MAVESLAGMILPQSAFVIVDLQRDFLPGGPLGVRDGHEIIAPIAALSRGFSTVVAAQDFHPSGHISFASSHPGRRVHDVIEVFGHEQVLWPDHCIAGSWGAALADGFPDAMSTLILRKGVQRGIDSYSAFREDAGADGIRATTGLGAWLRARGITNVYVAGLSLDHCVRATAMDAVHEGFETFVVVDLTRAVFPEARSTVKETLRNAGVVLLTSADLGVFNRW